MRARDTSVADALQAVDTRPAPADDDVASHDVERLRAAVAEHARLTLNFHPDRLDRHGRTVIAGLLADGRYRSQFETGISNGARFAVAGGDRPKWEAELFGDAYGDRTVDRPVYGALDITRDPFGGSPRFGSCALVLSPFVRDRTTLTVGDSHLGPEFAATLERPDAVLVGLLADAQRGRALGRLDVDALLAAAERPADRPARELDHYVEAQVHGGVDLADDVTSIMLDPSFRGTTVDTDARRIADRFGVDLRWHGGSELHVDRVPADFRGPHMPALARECARTDGVVDAAAIGRALVGEPYTPPTPQGDAPTSRRQRYKQLWHCVLHAGTDARVAGGPTAPLD